MSYFNRLYALVQEIEANTARLDRADEQARQRIIRHQIHGRLGTVAVSGEGGVIAVELDRNALRFINGAALGSAVFRAIIQAEADYRDRYAQTMVDARRGIVA